MVRDFIEISSLNECSEIKLVEFISSQRDEINQSTRYTHMRISIAKLVTGRDYHIADGNNFKRKQFYSQDLESSNEKREKKNADFLFRKRNQKSFAKRKEITFKFKSTL